MPQVIALFLSLKPKYFLILQVKMEKRYLSVGIQESKIGSETGARLFMGRGPRPEDGGQRRN